MIVWVFVAHPFRTPQPRRWVHACGSGQQKREARRRSRTPEGGCGRPERKWGLVSPPAPTVPDRFPAGAGLLSGAGFRPRPCGPGRSRRGSFARGLRFRLRSFAVRLRTAMRFLSPKSPVPHMSFARRLRTWFGGFFARRLGHRRTISGKWVRLRLAPAASRFFPARSHLGFRVSILADFLAFASAAAGLLRSVSGPGLSGHTEKLSRPAESHKRIRPVDNEDNGDKLRPRKRLHGRSQRTGIQLRDGGATGSGWPVRRATTC